MSVGGGSLGSGSSVTVAGLSSGEDPWCPVGSPVVGV